MYLRNRRAHQRKSVKAEGWIAGPTGDNWRPIATVDVSKGGFAFISADKIDINAVRRFRLQLPNDAGEMNVDGRITHCVALLDTGNFRVGVQAIQVDVIDVANMLIRPNLPEVNPALDLVLTRTIELPREQVWAAWTTPELLKQWFTPAPWTTVECELDLRPGGTFRTVMRSPEGQLFPSVGTYLEVAENDKLVWTNALAPGFRPAAPAADAAACDEFPFTAVIALEECERGTKYTAIVMHRDEEGRKKHEAMGFYEGWNAALDQLIALLKAT